MDGNEAHCMSTSTMQDALRIEARFSFGLSTSALLLALGGLPLEAYLWMYTLILLACLGYGVAFRRLVFVRRLQRETVATPEVESLKETLLHRSRAPGLTGWLGWVIALAWMTGLIAHALSTERSWWTLTFAAFGLCCFVMTWMMARGMTGKE